MRFPLSERFHLFPEVVVVVPYDLESGIWKTPILQGGVGVQWDPLGGRPRAHPPSP